MEGRLAMTTRNFFKVMMAGFEQKLNLPPAFCKKLKEEKSEWAIVKSRKGTWKIKVCRNCEGLMCFKDGWPDFVQNHGLRIGDFVLFEHVNSGLHFNAFIFGMSACEKEFLVEKNKKQEEAPEAANVNINHRAKNTKREAAKESGIPHNSRNPHFILTMKPHHAYKYTKATIPAEFLRSNYLGNKSSVSLRDPRGKAWPVKLLIERTRGFRCRMERGWHDFYASNKLKDGDVCVFELNRRSLRSAATCVLMDVQIYPATQKAART